MALKRMDNVGIVVEDLGGTIDFFRELGLREEVNFDETRITSRDWSTYPILRFPDLPKTVEVHLIDRPGHPFLGTGECAQGPTAAAIGNAVADATGLRLRELPFTAKRVKAAIGV
jgi:nicotinate dehydrogenase subunit B